MKILAVGGTFDEFGGKHSGYMSKLFSHFLASDVFELNVYNGGYWNTISSLVGRLTKDLANHYDIIFWFANIPNNFNKLVLLIKKYNKKCILVTSKNNLDNRCDLSQLIQKILKSKSNLVLEFVKPNMEKHFVTNIIDPLGNIWLSKEEDIHVVADVLKQRIKKLRTYTRVGSKSIGDAIPVPNINTFFDVIKRYAEVFHELIHGANSERLLGNASFRCCRGFPSFRTDNRIFVSRRNIDKRYIGSDGFVAVKFPLEKHVEYYGDMKPSVDTPVQLKLYEYFENVNFILHSHVYVDGAIFTDEVIPCGAMEEVDEITKLFDRKCYYVAVNLRGHGSLILAETEDCFENIPYIERKVLETQDV